MAPLLHVFISLLLATAAVAANSLDGDAAGNTDEWYDVAQLETDEDGINATFSTCDGRLGECNEDEEMAMESEVSRRILRNRERRHISYGALQKDKVPCGQRGASYYDCTSHSKVNPYRRECTIITKCARILS